MPEHSFTPILDGDASAYLNDLYEAGCDDATFGSVTELPYADFDRETSSPVEAILSPICGVESIPSLRVIRVEPDDLMTMSEIAAMKRT